MTRVLEHLRRFILHLQQKASLEFADWGFILSNMEEFFDCFYGLQSVGYRHCIAIAHDMAEKDEITGRLSIKPMLDGQMRNKIGSYVEEMYMTRVEVQPATGKANYIVMTRPVGNVSQARTSRNIDTKMEADFSVLFK